MKHGKKYVDAAKLVDKTKLYETDEALDTVIKTATAKFDETVELHVKLGVDSRHADQQVRGAVVLPNGTGKNVRVLAICKGANEELAKEAGADYVGAEDMTQKIQQENWMDFDVLVTTPDCMGLVGRLGRILGPRGLMPNPKAGTVTPDIARAIKEAKAGKIEYRLDKTNIIHCTALFPIIFILSLNSSGIIPIVRISSKLSAFPKPPAIYTFFISSDVHPYSSIKISTPALMAAFAI